MQNFPLLHMGLKETYWVYRPAFITVFSFVTKLLLQCFKSPLTIVFTLQVF